MYKLFILLFIIFIINYYFLGFKEHYIDNIVLCDSDLKIFKNNEVLKEIQKGCPTTAAATTAAATTAAATTAAATTATATTAAATTAAATTAAATTTGSESYTECSKSGYLQAGDNVIDQPMEFTKFTLDQAKAECNKYDNCGGITTNGSWWYLKTYNNDDVKNRTCKDSADWTSYFKNKTTTAASTTTATTISTTKCLHNYDETNGLDKLLNNNGKNTYIFTYINPESVQESKQLTMNGKWGNVLFIDLDGTRFTLEKNVVKYIYADENDYPIFIDKTELSGYSYVNDTMYHMIIFKSCDTLLMLVNTPAKEIIKFHVTKIEDYIPTTAAGTTK